MVRIGPAVLALLMIGAVGTAGVVAGGTFVSMTAHPVPGHPTAGESFAVDVHFAQAAGGETTAIEKVRVYDVTDGERHLATEYSGGVLGSGESQTVSVDDVTLDEPGMHHLRVEAVLVANGTERVVETTIRLEVYGTQPAIGVDVEPAVAGAWRSVNLTLANRHNATLRGITVGIEGEDVRVRSNERVASALASGQERTLEFRAASSRLGRHELAVSMSYNVAGESKSFRRTIPVNFSAPEAPTEARLTDVNVTGVQTGLRIDGVVVNDGSNEIEGASVSVADVDGVSPTPPSPEAFVGSIEAGSRGSFTVTAEMAANRSAIPLEVSYRVGGVEYTTVHEVAYDGPRSVQAVQVTDLSITPSAAGVRINASAAAVGIQDAGGVRVTVLEQPGVQPVTPRSGVFLGSVRSGRSVPFELTASVAGNRDTIPLSIRYTVDGTSYNETLAISYDGPTGVAPIELTGVSTTARQGTIEIRGSAANTGTQPVDSVLVSIRNAEGVEPTAPYPEYFVGSVQSSDFASFTVSARVTGNRTTVPLTVSYTVDGRTYNVTRVVEVSTQPSRSTPDSGQSRSGGGLPLPLVVVGLVVLALGAVAYRRLG